MPADPRTLTFPNRDVWWVAFGPGLTHGALPRGQRLSTGMEVLEIFDSAAAQEARLAELHADLDAILQDHRAQGTDPLRRLAAHRWRREMGGTKAPDGLALRTDERTRLAITSGISALSQEPPGTQVPWKLGDGRFVALDLPALTAIQRAVSTHVQRCFAAEQSVAAQLAADPATPLYAIGPAFDQAYADLAAAADTAG